MRRNKTLSGKAVEKLCLFRLLALYIGHLVPENNPVWLAYLMLRMICDFILAPVVDRDNMSYLEFLIVQYFRMMSDIGTTRFPQNALFDTLSAFDVAVWTNASSVVHEDGSQTPIL